MRTPDKHEKIKGEQIVNSMLKHSTPLLIVLLLIALTGCQVVNIATPEPTSTIDQIIFFSADSDIGPLGIYRINADGSGLTRLAELPPSGFPVLSPDGKKIAFASGGNLHVMNLDGTHLKRITNLGQLIVSDPPAWSPDGQRLAFTVQESFHRTIYLINVNGTGLEPLDNGKYEAGSMWSPDGKTIAFLSSPYEHGTYGIKTISVQEGGFQYLSSPAYEDGLPIWSPDGSQMAFGSLRDGSYGIYLMNKDGSNQTRLLETSVDDGLVDWSPDGQLITLLFKREGKSVIYTMNLAEALQGTEAGQPTPLTDSSANNYDPWWSSDGQRIVFASDRDGNLEIYVMNADGSNQTRLTNTPEDDWGPVWLPR